MAKLTATEACCKLAREVGLALGAKRFDPHEKYDGPILERICPGASQAADTICDIRDRIATLAASDDANTAIQTAMYEGFRDGQQNARRSWDRLGTDR